MKTENLDNFTRAYIECALWSSMDESTPAGGEPMDKNYSAADIADEAGERIIADCKQFQDMLSVTMTETPLTLEQCGYNFWLSRNGHGTGFWDRIFDTPEQELALMKCDAVSKAPFGECNLYVGDDGKIYIF